MASLSSLFGIGTQQQQQPQAATITTQELPKQVAPYYEKLLKEAEGLYKQKMEAGAPIYEGKTMAGFTPEQEQLFTGIQGLVGTQAPKFAEAEALTRGTAAKITPDEVQEYMNPYQQAVVDIEKREAQKQYESTVVPQLAAQAAATGGFGGSRQAILEGMASEAQQRLLSDIQAKGSAQAYQDAMSNIQQQRQREGAAAGQLAQLAPAGFAAQAQELGAIGKVGDVKQQQAQLALDEAYKQFLQEQQFPSEALKEYQSYVQSFPNIATQITRTPPPQQPSLAQTLIGGLGTAAGAYGAFGGFTPGGLFGMKNAETGGGIADLPVVQAKKGTSDKIINEAKKDFNYFRDTPFGRGLAGLVKGIGYGAERSFDELAALSERGIVRPTVKFFSGYDLPPVAEKRLVEKYPDRTLISRDVKDEEKFMPEYRKDKEFEKYVVDTDKVNPDPNIMAFANPGEGGGGVVVDKKTDTAMATDVDDKTQKEIAEAPTVQKEFSDITGEAKVKEPVKTEPTALEASQTAYMDYLQKMSEAAAAEKGALDQEAATTPYLRLLQASSPLLTGKSNIPEALTKLATDITEDKKALTERKKVIDGKVDTINLKKLKFDVDKEVGKANLEWTKKKAEDESKDRKTKLAIDYLKVIATAQSQGKKTLKVPTKNQADGISNIITSELNKLDDGQYANLIAASNMSESDKAKAIKSRDKFIKGLEGNKNIMNAVSMKILQKDAWSGEGNPTSFILNNFADTITDTSTGIPLTFDKGFPLFGTPTVK